ncbi:MAG: DUF1501 domain-containing protein, partial [Acidobacteriota bacterium]|nr:DUF1501 domain-containing protein [Acidobacteriota bacterium]
MLRRDFLQLSAVPFLPNVQGGKADVSCILLMLVGGPSHLDTWDMKPDAPANVRGPFRPIRTNVPGIEISEIFPRMARHADKFALIRSVHHDGPAVHATGYQLMQTGRIATGGVEYPHVGCVVAKATGTRHVLVGGEVLNTGGTMAHGQSAGLLGAQFAPIPGPALKREPDDVRERYGLNAFGQNCLKARQLVEAGTRFVTVNMFDSVFDQPTWDSHG